MTGWCVMTYSDVFRPMPNLFSQMIIISLRIIPHALCSQLSHRSSFFFFFFKCLKSNVFETQPLNLDLKTAWSHIYDIYSTRMSLTHRQPSIVRHRRE